jgi:hypothetical protein
MLFWVDIFLPFSVQVFWFIRWQSSQILHSGTLCHNVAFYKKGLLLASLSAMNTVFKHVFDTNHYAQMFCNSVKCVTGVLNEEWLQTWSVEVFNSMKAFHDWWFFHLLWTLIFLKHSFYAAHYGLACCNSKNYTVAIPKAG